MSELTDVFSNIYSNWGFGGYPESRSGPGSTLDNTENIRLKIRQLVKEYGIKTVVDLPCGDFNWMKEIVYGFEKYTGADIVPEIIEENQKYANSIIQFVHHDLTSDDEIPEADLLIVRDVIGHLPLELGKKAIDKIKKSKCKYLLSTTWFNLNDSSYHEKHSGNTEVSTGRFYPVCLRSDPFNFPEPIAYLEENGIVDGYEDGVRKGLGFWEIASLSENLPISSNQLTVVSGLWDIGRIGRDFTQYIENFKKFLNMPVNLYLYLPQELHHIVWDHPNRNTKNTVVRTFELSDIKNNYYKPFWEITQDIRTSDEWLHITGENGWLSNSPQAKNMWYNPIVQSKMFMLHDAKVINPFNTEYFLWIDAGITNTVSEHYFTEERCLDKITPYLDKFLFLSYPYEAVNEIHGFDYSKMNELSEGVVKYVCRGGLFGGHKDYISQANADYYALLDGTLSQGYMGTEESIFTILAHRDPFTYKRFMLKDHGMIANFMEALVDDSVKLEGVTYSNKPRSSIRYNKQNVKTSLYVLTFNFPKQFAELAESFLQHPEWLNNTRKILINNSNDPSVMTEYDNLCKEFDFEHIVTGENLGINRGRMFAAKHFHESDSDFYFFFEDDMLMHAPTDKFCRNGFRKYVPNLYESVHNIMLREEFDFLKLSFTEVYMDNNIQVSWYNVPQHIRTEVWPDYDKLPISGLDPNAPRTKFNTIGNYDGLSYISGDIYYANWPMIVSREGNKKMFIDTQWQNPYEQTWMSYMFQETIKGTIKPAVLLASPINHNRISHYKPEERREN